jgi:hypothetical protein
MSKEEAGQWVSTPEITSLSQSIERWDSPAPPVSLYFLNGELASASTRYTGFATPTGLAPGAEANLRELTREYQELEAFQSVLWTPGLNIFVSGDGRVAELEVRPELTRP